MHEGLVSEALSLRNAYADGSVELAVLDLFWLELGNTLWKAERAQLTTRKAVSGAVEAISERPIPTAPSFELLREAFSIAVAFRCTVYDASYAAWRFTPDVLL